ncbi:hypothetical protein [Brevundimonas sp. SORGH_AS_0993]|uniref:hypothetical protein n=1 Tax=Brevundimonas sp. SORGH_AS_0993 TaxID=3041794 RepID=UPI00277D269F|nr:hypothetical protein [Brevundimonas sp. SORGH_AS_0993]MDQ1155071.1 hypothetical protein [Brevundimonas sp. SORGH_AS_0993]
MFGRFGVVVAVSALLAGCVTAVDPMTANAPLKLAFTEPVPSLEARAAEGDRQAQYALSFLKKVGLRGVASDPVGAESLRALAGAPRSRTLPIYQPGVNGNPGTILNVQITDPGVSDADARRLDLCGMVLLTAMPALGGQVCGSPEAYADLLPGAMQVRAETTLSATMVEPAGVARCEDVDRLWASAVVRYETGAEDEAVAATDRIIALCGETQPSWHARIMRALLALGDEDPDRAVALLAPIPRPAPAPIGGYVGFVAMAAQAERDDWAAYAKERDTVLGAAVQALAAERGTTALGRLEQGPYAVDLFERQTALHPGLTGLIVGVARSTEPRAAPRTFWLTTSPDPMGGSDPVYFLDEYRCDGRSTYMYFPKGAARPGLDAIKTLIGEVLGGERQRVSGMAPGGPPDGCAFPYFVAPGLGDDPTRPDQDAAASASSTPLP